MSRFGKKEVQVDPDKVPPGIDKETFFSPQIPDEVRASVPLMHSMPAELIRPCLQKILRCMTTEEFTQAEYIEFQESLGQKGGDFSTLFTGLFVIIRIAIAMKVNLVTMNTDLKKMHVPPGVADDLCKALRAQRPSIESQAIVKMPGFSKLKKLRWRIDVTISSGSLSRVMRPNVTFQCILGDGSIKTFEISIEQFNQLRYGVAKLLLEMRMLERHPIMKIVNEFERKDKEERYK